MSLIDDCRLEALLAAEPLPAPPPALVERAARRLRFSAPPAVESPSWRERLAEVTAAFQAALATPQPALLAVVVRGEPGGDVTLTDAPDAVLVQTVAAGAVHGQIFLAGLESPAGFLVELHCGDALLEEDLTDAAGRFVFTGLAPGEYRLALPDLGLGQDVHLAP